MLVLLHFLGRVVFASFLKKKSGACSGRVPGVLFFLYFLKKNLGRVLGVFWACSGRVLGVLFFALILKNKWGVFRACSGCVVFASFFYKKYGACSRRVQS